MKKIKYFAMTLAACMAFASCSTDIDQPRLAPVEGDNYPAPTLAACADLIVNNDNSSEQVSFVCSEVDFGLSLAVNYQLYLEKAGQSVQIAASSTPTITVTKSDINGTLINVFGAEPDAQFGIGAYVVAYAGESNIHTEKSNTVQFNVQTYRAALRKYYLVGAFNGWSEKTAPSMWETAGGSNTYAGMYHMFEADYAPGESPFQLLPTLGTWDGQLGFAAFSSMSSNLFSNGNDLSIAAGIYQITANVAALSIDAVAVNDFYVAGSWNGWGNSTKLIYDPAANVWKSEIPVPAGSEFKVVYEAPSQTWLGDTGKTAENMPEGCTDAIELGDGGNFTSPAADKYVVVYTDRTPYVIAYE